MCIPKPHYNLKLGWVLVYVDTNSLLAGALAAKKLHIKVTMRDDTEWVELVENGFNLLAGSDDDRILKCVRELQLKDQVGFENRLYGKGDAGEKVLEVLMKF